MMRLYFAFLLSFIAVELYSQTDDNKLPTKNNHTFVPISVSSPAFTNTYFLTNTGIGNTIDFSYPLFEVPNGKLLTLKGDPVNRRRLLTTPLSLNISFKVYIFIPTIVISSIWS